MAFNPLLFSLSTDTIGGGSLRIWFYKTTDNDATVKGADYFTDVADMGVRENDLVIVTTNMGTANAATFVGEFSNLSVLGNGTVITTLRQRLNANTVKYVDNSTGSASGTGEVGSKWLTLQQATDFVASTDLNGYTITINCTGTFTDKLAILGTIFGAKDHTSVLFFGVGSFIIDYAYANANGAVQCAGGAKFSIANFEIRNSYHGCVSTGVGSYLRATGYTFRGMTRTGAGHETACFLSFNCGSIEIFSGGTIDTDVDNVFNAQHMSFIYIDGSGSAALTFTAAKLISEIHYARSNSLIRYSSAVAWTYPNANLVTTMRPYLLISNGILAYAGKTVATFNCSLDGREEAGGQFWKAQNEFPKVGTFTLDLSSTADTTVVVGFRPKSLIFHGNINSTPGRMSMGVAGDLPIYTMCLSDGHTITANSFVISTVGSQMILRIGDGVDYLLVYIKSDAYNNDGFTLEKTRGGSITGTYTVNYWALSHS